MNPSHKRNFPFRVFIPAIAGLFLFSGCYVHYSNYGNYRFSREVGRLFESGKLPTDYTYYYAHTHSQPEALIGIAPEYTLDNNLWTRVNPSQLKRLMDNMWVRSGYSPFIYGSYIVSPDGKIIGIYYSRWDGGPIVMESDNRVNVNLPNRQPRHRRLPSFRFFMEDD